MSVGVAPADAAAADLIERQVLRQIRRALLGLMAAEASKYGLTLAQVATALRERRISPFFERQFDEFMRTVGMPRAVVIDLGLQVLSAGRDDWELDDLQVIVNAYANAATQTATARPATQEQLSELVGLTKRVWATAKRREQNRPRMDALVRQALDIPDGERT